MFDDQMPSYMKSADNHNIGNLNPEWGSSVDEESPWSERAKNFTGSAIMSGINSFYNTGVAVGNLFTSEETAYRDTRDWIASYDENMAAYYDENRQAADLVGFVVSSFVPGLGGVKVFNAGAKMLTAAKEGIFGLNMSRGLGVLPGARDILVKEAIEGYTTSQAAFAFTEARTLKAIASGFGEQALQAAAFETAVAATMFKSPILDGQSIGDLISNIAWGTLVGGGIGGAIQGAITTYGIKSGIRALDAKLVGVTQTARGVEGTSASDNLMIYRNDLEITARNAPEGVDAGMYEKLWEAKIRHIDNESRNAFTTIAGGDAKLGNRLYESLRADPTETYYSKLMNLQEVAPQSQLGKMVKKYSLLADEGEEAGQFATRTLKMWGDDAGKLSDEMPRALALADDLKPGQVMSVGAREVRVGDTAYKIKLGEAFNPSEASYKDNLARHIWANDDTVPKLAVPKGQDYLPIGRYDIATLTKAYREGFTDFYLVTGKGEAISSPANRESLLQYIAQVKDRISAQLLERGIKGGKELEESAERIANITDTPLKYLTGEQYSTQLDEAIFGLKAAQKQHYQKFYSNIDNPPPMESVKPWLEPQNYHMIYDTQRLGGIDNFQVEAMTIVKQRQVLQQQSLENAAMNALGEDKHGLLPEFTDAYLRGVNRGGAGSGFFSFSNANYGTAGSFAEYVGSLVTRWTQQNTERVADTFANVNSALVNSPENMTRLAAVLQKTRAAGTEKYVLSDSGTELILKKIRDYERAVANGDEAALPPTIPAGVDETIPFGSPEVGAWIKQHIDFTGARNTKFNGLRHAKGQYDDFDPQEFYPPAPNPNRFKYHAFAQDPSITSGQHTSMLYADSAENLQKQIDAMRAQGFEVYTKGEVAQYKRARGEYDYSKGFNSNYMDAQLQRSGASAPTFPLTGNPEEMIQDIMQWHKRQEDILTREAVSNKYSRQFGTLHQMGEQYTLAETSRGGVLSRFKKEIKNPYEDYVKTALGVSRVEEYPVWKAINDGIDIAGTKVWNAVKDIWDGIRGNDKIAYNLDQINGVLKEYGIQNAATPAQLEAWVNHPAGQGAVSRFVSSQNAILATLVLRLDPINALNNAVGSTVLTGAETRAVVNAIRNSNEAAVGELSRISQINLPGTGDPISSPQKLIAQAYRNFFADDGTLLKKYQGMEVIADTPQQFKNLLEHLTIRGTETAAELDSRITKAMNLAKNMGDLGERFTGNRLAEQMNRFVSANIMDQLTDIAVRAGAMDEKTAGAYINTFVNRTQGNVIASQRPQMFQGPLGQALGLFQSYQFNIMQQLLRYVGEGSKKDALTLLGLQSTIYGANGLPAFQAINTHIIGTASGNTSHTDAYSSIYNVAGKNAGDWITYGLASNFLLHPDLKLNLYSRGDINPRTVTVVPTNLQDVPVISSWARMFTAVKGSMSSIANGGDVWNSFLSGVEHQGINRPLSGMARVLRGADGGVSFSTSGQGNIVASNDFNALTNLARLSGAKPLDEAVTQDAMFRVQSYSRADAAKRAELGKAVRSVIVGGKDPTSEQLEGFMTAYAKLGGKQEEFNRWYMSQLRTANTPQANKIVEKGNTPYAKYMQEIMGGRLYKTPADILATQPTGEGE